MKLRSNKEYTVGDLILQRFKSTSIEKRKKTVIEKSVPQKSKTDRRKKELEVKLDRINPGNVTKTQWINYLKEIDRQDKEKQDNLREKLRIIGMTDHVKPVDALVCDGNMSENWRRFKRNYDIFASAAKVNTQTNDIKINTFLNAIGPDAVDLFDSFSLTDAQRLVYETVVESFETYCNPRKNVIYERFRFNQRNQRDGEKFDEFLLDLKFLARYCNFGTAENELLRDRIVGGIIDNRLRGRLLETADLTLDQCITKAKQAKKQE